jgi:superfamily II DNA or RNA helicase
MKQQNVRATRPARTASSCLALRPYQEDAIARIDQTIRGGARRVLVVAPTGAGKTVLAARLVLDALASGKRVLFLAHRRELIHQAYARFQDAGIPESDLGIVMAGDPRRRPPARVQIASVDTLRSRASAAGRGATGASSLPRADVMIVDECHRVMSPTYKALCKHYASAVQIGLSATPYRSDGQGLGNAYDALVHVASIRELIAQGFLVEPLVVSTHVPSLAGVRVRGGDYVESDLVRVMDKDALIGDIVEHWKRYGGNQRTVAFAVSVNHSRRIVERFAADGIPAEHLDGATPVAQRDAILARLERGETRVVSNVGVLCEGWDMPSVKTLILARPTKSTGLYLQQAGRILRPWNSVPATILDHAGCWLAHGLPDDEREVALGMGRGTVKPKSERRPRRCLKCMAVARQTDTKCRVCGAELSCVPVPTELTGELAPVSKEDAEAKRQEMRQEWDRICAECADRGYKPGWAYYRFRDRFHMAPPRSFPRAEELVERVKLDFATSLENAVLAGTLDPAWARAMFAAELGRLPPDAWPAAPAR